MMKVRYTDAENSGAPTVPQMGGQQTPEEYDEEILSHRL
jgi:hypothetical protein